MTGTPLCGRRVLVIEDDPDYREILGRLLRSLGAQVAEATNGLAGLEELGRWHPDMVFCGLRMPIMGGLEFARRMRQRPPYQGVLLIAVTERDTQADLRDTWSVGFDGYLVKPVTDEMLAWVVRRLPGKSGAPVDRPSAGA